MDWIPELPLIGATWPEKLFLKEKVKKMISIFQTGKHFKRKYFFFKNGSESFFHFVCFSSIEILYG